MSEYFKKYIIQVLEDKGFNINSESLFNDVKYEKLKEGYIFMQGVGIVTFDYFIEKQILTQEQIKKMKQGKFDINVNREDELDKVNSTALYREIETEKIKHECDEIEATGMYDGMYNLEDLDKDTDLKGKFNNIRQEIEGKSGLKVKLKNNFGFDFDSFKNEQYQKLKLIKLLYTMHEKDSKLYDILGNPTLESVENPFIKGNKNYGKILNSLKNEVIKEIEGSFVLKVKEETLKIGDDWERIIQNITYRTLFEEKSVLNSELTRINTFLKESIIAKLPNIKSVEIPYEYKVFETFYLKLIQYESISRYSDICKANLYETMPEGVTEFYKKEYEAILMGKVKINEVEEYIKNNINRISQLVYMTNKVSEENLNFLKGIKFKNCIKNFIDIWVINTTYNRAKEISLLLIISCIQEIIYSLKVNEEYVIKYYGYKTEHKSMISKLRNVSNAREVYQILWIRKVKQRIYFNLGLKEELMLLTSIEMNIDKLTSFIMQYHNLNDMLMVHEHFLSIVERSIVYSIDVEEDLNNMRNFIYNSVGYDLLIGHNNIFNYFKETKNMGISEQVNEHILNNVKMLESKKLNKPYYYTTGQGFKVELELFDMDDNNPKIFLLMYFIDIDRKSVILTHFNETKSDEYIDKMISLGLHNFFIK